MFGVTSGFIAGTYEYVDYLRITLILDDSICTYDRVLYCFFAVHSFLWLDHDVHTYELYVEFLQKYLNSLYLRAYTWVRDFEILSIVLVRCNSCGKSVKIM